MNEAEDQEVRPGRNPLLRPLRFLLHWTIKLIVLAFLGVRAVLRPRPVRYGVAALVAIAIVTWALTAPALTGRRVAAAGSPAAAQTAAQASAVQSQAASGAASSEPVSVPVNRTMERAPVVEQYLKAQSSFDANGMWSAISDNLKQQLAASNTDVKALQDQLDKAKQEGRQYGTPLYVGGVPIDSSAVAYFYVVTVNGPDGTSRVPYIYVVGQDGKIDSIQ